MELFAKKVDCIQPLIIFVKLFILGVSQGYEYASDKTQQNPGALPFISQKLGLQYLQIVSTFKFNFIFALLPCGETLLITNSIHVFLISN